MSKNYKVTALQALGAVYNILNDEEVIALYGGMDGMVDLHERCKVQEDVAYKFVVERIGAMLNQQMDSAALARERRERATDSKAKLNIKLASIVYEKFKDNQTPFMLADVIGLGMPDITSYAKATAVMGVGIKRGLFKKIIPERRSDKVRYEIVRQ